MKKIDVDLNRDGTITQMDECDLERREGPGWVEYWLDGKCVHRSATVGASGVSAKATEGKFPGYVEKKP